MKTIHRRLTILIAAAALSLGAITTLLLVGRGGPPIRRRPPRCRHCTPSGSTRDRWQYSWRGSPGRIRYSTSMSPACPAEEQERLHQGIPVYDDKELQRLLEVTPAEDRRAVIQPGDGTGGSPVGVSPVSRRNTLEKYS